MGPCYPGSAPREYSRASNVINDLYDAAKGEVNTVLYADDSKIFGAVKCARVYKAEQSTLSNMDS